VTDAFAIGDRFRVFDFTIVLGETSLVPVAGNCGSDPTVCLSSASHRTFRVRAGHHSITIRPTVSPFSAGAAYFQVVNPR
jgi:hypothetical protein